MINKNLTPITKLDERRNIINIIFKTQFYSLTLLDYLKKRDKMLRIMVRKILITIILVTGK